LTVAASGSPCSGHRTGPICALCEPGYSSASGTGACSACPSPAAAWAFSVCISFIFVMVIVFIYWVVLRTDRGLMREAKIRHQQRKENEWAWFEDDESAGNVRKDVYEKDISSDGSVPRAKPNFTYKMKIILGFLQITTNLAIALYTPWPSYYQSFIADFNILNFDFIQWSSIGCVVNADYYTKFLAITITPIAVLILVFLFYWVPRYIRSVQRHDDYDLRRAAEKRSRRQFWKLFLFTLFLIYPGVSSTVLRLFVCENVNGTNYLLSDFSVLCFTSKWTEYALIDILFILLYPIGVPLYFFILLYSNRNKLLLPDIRIQIGFLYEAYNGDHWWFELVDMANKLFLTSILAFFPFNAQLPMGFAWAFAYLDVLLLVKPYVRKGDDSLHLYAETEIALILLAAWVYYSLDVSTLDTTTDVALSVVLILISVGVIIYFLFQLGLILKKMFDRRKLERELKARREKEKEAELATTDMRALRLPANAHMTRNPFFELMQAERK